MLWVTVKDKGFHHDIVYHRAICVLVPIRDAAATPHAVAMLHGDAIADNTNNAPRHHDNYPSPAGPASAHHPSSDHVDHDR
ncbi:hypothetical protein LU631_19740 [Erwinia tracheiphila]|nr:hypothetical protein [Erwinia tracheiphila]UIA87001.1 hypothetical protein LU631_19740 [Erwinia tracheiphila]UIA95359.1 hypothetical protein LU633_18195 [Erwinia tracheiphila]